MPSPFANLNKKRSKITFDVEKVDVSVVNALRRTVISEVPTVAIAFDPTGKSGDIVVHTNTGSLHNEFLAHRFSLLPLHFPKEEVEMFIPSRYMFELKVKNTTEEMMDVTSKHVQIYDEHGKRYPQSFRDTIFPMNHITGDHILLTRLKPNLFDKEKGDEIYLQAYASVDIGKSHSRWSPVSVCSFYNNVDPEEKEKGFKEYKKEHQNKALSDAELSARFDTLQQFRCFKKNEYMEPDSFRFTLESECGLSPEYIFRKGIAVLSKKLGKFIDAIDTEDGTVVFDSQHQNMHYITVKGEDHTLGNLIQAMFYNMYVRKGKQTDEEGVSYIGYYKPHPLEDCILIKVAITGDNVRDLMKQGAKKIVAYLQQLGDEWDRFVGTESDETDA